MGAEDGVKGACVNRDGDHAIDERLLLHQTAKRRAGAETGLIGGGEREQDGLSR